MEGGRMAGQTQVRSEGPKNVFETPPPFSQGLDLPLLCSKKKQLLLDFKFEYTF